MDWLAACMALRVIDAVIVIFLQHWRKIFTVLQPMGKESKGRHLNKCPKPCCPIRSKETWTKPLILLSQRKLALTARQLHFSRYKSLEHLKKVKTRFIQWSGLRTWCYTKCQIRQKSLRICNSNKLSQELRSRFSTLQCTVTFPSNRMISCLLVISFNILLTAWPMCGSPLAYGGPSWSMNSSPRRFSHCHTYCSASLCRVISLSRSTRFVPSNFIGKLVRGRNSVLEYFLDTGAFALLNVTTLL